MSIEFLHINNELQIQRLADIAEQIWHEYFPQILTLEQINYMVEKFQSAAAVSEQIKNGGYKYFLLLKDGEALGYIAIKEDEQKLFLSKLYLKKEYRGMGYFNEMLSFIERFAKENRLSSLYLTVNKHNGHSISVYQKKGFIIVNELVTDIGGGFVMDDYLMEKTI